MKAFLKRKLPAFLMALVMVTGLLPAASAASADIVLKVDAGEEVAFDRGEFKSYFEDQYDDGEFRYVTFEPDSSYKSSVGQIYYDYNGSDEESFSRSDLRNGGARFYYSNSKTYSLRDTSFVASKDAEDTTLSIEFWTYGYDGDGDEAERSGELQIRVSGRSGSGDGDIVLNVDAGDEVSLSPSKFKSYFEDRYDETFRYVTFEPDSTYQSSNGYVYYDHDGKNEVRFSKSRLSDYQFYYSSSSYGDYPLDGLSFVADEDADGSTVTIDFRACGKNSERRGTLEICIGGSGTAKGSIEYEVKPGEEAEFDESDFNRYYDKNASGSFRYVEFTGSKNLTSSNGYMYCNYGRKKEVRYTSSSLKKTSFYYGDYDDVSDYALDSLSFVADDSFDGTVTLEFRAYGTNGRYADGTVVIRSTGGKNTSTKGDITYSVGSGQDVSFQEKDFRNFYDSSKGTGTFRYLTFTNASQLKNPNGILYSGKGTGKEEILSWSTLDKCQFYASTEDGDDYSNGYPLNRLAFAAGREFDTAVTLKFRAWSSGSRYVDGTLVIKPDGTTADSAAVSGNIFYNTTYNTNLQINPNDIARYFNKTYPNAALSYVKLTGVPATGTLYYNYYGTSAYGARKTAIAASGVSAAAFYFSPASTSQYSLSELTFTPNSRANYCDMIPFTAYGSGGQSVSGTILISVTLAAVSDIYGVTPKNSSVDFPAASFYSAVSSATGTALGSIRLLTLPSASAGTVYVGSGTAAKADTKTLYQYSSGTQRISQLRFVPASGYAGSVEMVYVAYNTSGAAVASGKFCLGIVNSKKNFSDIAASTWCYKYVEELSDASVISGYSDGSFRPNSNVTYGAALKLIMLAAGYKEQAPTGKHTFSGYLTKAKADGLVSGTVDLNKTITRLQVAQLAAKALKLDTANLSSLKPFTDTKDPYVQALNAAGVVEGYFSGGTSTYKPNNTLTRGQISAIVWRMQQLRK